MIPLQEKKLEESLCEVSKEAGLQTYVESLAEGWVTLWIYKHEHILDVIKSAPQAPKTAFDHWVLGKLFGYDETSIQEFLRKR